MLDIRKHYVLDENQQPIAVQISIVDFERIEALLKQLSDTDPQNHKERAILRTSLRKPSEV